MSFLKSTIETLQPSSLKALAEQLNELITKRLWLKVLLGFILGIAAGVLLSREVGWIPKAISETVSEWIAFPGHLFLRIVQMIVIPLIIASVITGIASSDNMERLKKLGIRIGFYFLFTTTVSLAIGLLVVTLLRPGNFVDVDSLDKGERAAEMNMNTMEKNTEKPLPKAVVDLLPKNPIAAMSESNMLQIVLFSLIVGFALISMQAEKAKPLLNLLDSVQQVCMTVVKWAMYLAPFAVFGLTAKMISTVGFDALVGLAAYVGTVLAALLLVVCFYTFLLIALGKRNPVHFFKQVFQVQLLAFSTSSSAAVMPMSIKTAEEKLDIRPSISHFVVPLGATINMDGTAIYQMVATVFLSQVFQVDLSLVQMVLIGATAVGASIGTPGTPGVGIVILATILKSAGIPVEGISLILAVDRILDMSRTGVNVTGDLTACVIMNKFLGDVAETSEEQKSLMPKTKSSG